MAHDRLREILIRHEGLRLKPYRCTAGKLSIGVGRNLDDNGITEFEAMHLLTSDMNRVESEAIATLPWFKSISVPRQDVVLCMIFNLGLTKFLGFKKFIKALRWADFELAADEMLTSAWAVQVGKRAGELAKIMRTNSYQSIEGDK